MIYTPLFWLILGFIFWGLHLRWVSVVCWAVFLFLWGYNHTHKDESTGLDLEFTGVPSPPPPKVGGDYKLRAEEWQKRKTASEYEPQLDEHFWMWWEGKTTNGPVKEWRLALRYSCKPDGGERILFPALKGTCAYMWEEIKHLPMLPLEPPPDL